MKFTLTLDKHQIAQSYQENLKKTAQNTTIKGYRQGKAPLKVVEEQIDKAKIYEQVLNQLLPPAYAAYIKTHDLHPITLPKITLKSAEPDADWQIEAEIAEKPKVTLGNYESEIKALEKPPKIHLPHDHHEEDDSESKLLNQIFDVLLKTCSVTVPDLLIDEEVNHRLSQLMYQIDKLGLNLDSYTASLNKTASDLKAEYRHDADASLKLEFILDAIATTQKLTASTAEIDAFVKKVDDEKVRKTLTSDPSQRQNLAVALTKRKVTDYLLSLTASPIILSK